MGANIKLHEYIGKPVMIHEPDAYVSDAIAATGCDEGVPVGGFSNVLFILQLGDYSSDAGGTLQIQYSSTGAAGSAATSETSWTCTDAVMTFDSDDGTGNEVLLADFSISAKTGINDAGGKLYATWLGLDGGVDFALMAIPYGGTRLLPSTNENTVQEFTSIA